MNKQHSEKINI